MNQAYVTIIPAYRVSTKVQPEVRLFCCEKSELKLDIIKHGEVLRSFNYQLFEAGKEINIFPDLSGIVGDIILEFNFYQADGNIFEKKSRIYQIIDSQCNSTTLLDGCWVSLYHWSEDEARWFNKDLKKLTNEDWKEQIYAMDKAGIKGIVIQNVFDSDKYVHQHDMTALDYTGKAFYPSKLFEDRVPLTADDSIEAILSAADEVNMNVLLGVGLYAWFDFSDESLKWHKEVTKELYAFYGHHQSLYCWYISEEMFGSLYYDYPPVPDEKYKDIVKFFKEYKTFVQQLTPTKPVALAPNNIRFHEYEKEWKEILVNIDILIPFAFARDLDNLNIKEIAQICKSCGTHFWVDLEIFEFPLDNGLVPKTCEELIKEIRIYDDVEQIYGYQYTGIMNSPDNKFNLGGEKAKQLYKEYINYYKQIK
jgi:hypothetical protein